MRKARPSGIERLESYLVKLIQEKGADLDQPFGIRMLLAFLKFASCLFAAGVAIRYFLYRTGLKRRYPLGIQVISIGNVTAGGTGKTPVTEIFARTLATEGRKVAILSRGYRRKEAPWWVRMFTQVVSTRRSSRSRSSSQTGATCFSTPRPAATSRTCSRRTCPASRLSSIATA